MFLMMLQQSKRKAPYGIQIWIQGRISLSPSQQNQAELWSQMLSPQTFKQILQNISFGMSAGSGKYKSLNLI